MLMNIQQVILTANRCFENGDVDCTIILAELRQSQRSLNRVSTIGENNKRQIEATIAALIDQIELKMANHRQENAFVKTFQVRIILIKKIMRLFFILSLFAC